MNRAPVTAKGAEELKAELHKLKTVERPRIVQAIAEAREHGDLKENAEYHAAREQQGFNEGRVQELEGILSTAQVIDVPSLAATNGGGPRSRCVRGPWPPGGRNGRCGRGRWSGGSPPCRSPGAWRARSRSRRAWERRSGRRGSRSTSEPVARQGRGVRGGGADGARRE